MDNTQPTQGPSLTGQVLFYSNPQPLSAEQHAGLGLKQIEKPFAFLGKAHAVPLTVNEFGLASTSFPIIFVGEEKTPIAAMGIRQEENLFVSADGTVDSDFYVPAFARRYPFVFANDQSQDRLLLCVDRDAPMVSNRPDVPFFENGQPTEYTNNVMQFCQDFERQRRATTEFVKRLEAHGLFTQKSANFQPRDRQGNPTGEQQTVAEYWAVDDQKLNELSAEQIEGLHKDGSLGAIYAHMISLLNWSRVINRAVGQQSPQAAPEPQGGSEGPSLQI